MKRLERTNPSDGARREKRLEELGIRVFEREGKGLKEAKNEMGVSE